ncbi:hypothetical protein J41TS12_44890 [Paenibacillus antibioticophila]|uniref:NAD(P)-binding domain-containing protein n=1 Tax=Paenibacillus antibioticophila TaxID=1274374 RepID=A0A920CJE1_9BACL|nr:NAD(P)-binding oxidoreductase [Paenibacillus antibioticophila]GIO39628.1 hypothetical protein J41TS12_44890 [Paenibacillus antibioticophila]
MDQFRRYPGTTHFGLRIVKGDVFDSGTFHPVMEGKDAVVSALGVQQRKPTTVYSQGTRNIMEGMSKYGVKRLICVSSSALELPPQTPFLSRFFLEQFLKRLLKNLYADMERMEHAVRRSDLDWSVIRPPRLTNGPVTHNYRISVNEPMVKPKMIRGVSRADVADCIVSQLNNSASLHGVIEISY